MYFIYSDFRDELRRKGVNNLEKAVQKEFPGWFKNHVSNMENAPEDLRSLANGPEPRVVVHSICNVNGARFRTVAREKHLSSQNSGVMTTASIGDNEQEMEYYGVLTEVLELRYMANDHGDRSVFLFRCNWFDLASRTSKMKDDGFFKSVNTAVLWCKHAPFILASQAKTCFYLDDTEFGEPWKVVQLFRDRNVYDVPEKDAQGSSNAYQEDSFSEDFIVHQSENNEDEAEFEDQEVVSSDEVVHVDAHIVHEILQGRSHEEIDSSDDEQQVDKTTDEDAGSEDFDSDDDQ